jgi:hypothetical protein
VVRTVLVAADSRPPPAPTSDRGTPYSLAVAEQRQIPHSVLLTLDGLGHAAYLGGHSSCINAAVERYLFDLQLPPPGTVCQLDSPGPA